VHALLGTASDERLLDMIEALVDHDAATALRLLEQSTGEGVQPADLLSGLIDFVRDAMMLSVGADAVLLSISPRQRPRLDRNIKEWTVDSISSALQILAECRGRMRGSAHGRLLLELALVRVARLEDLALLGTLVERLAALESGTPAPHKPEAGSDRRTPLSVDTPIAHGGPSAQPVEFPKSAPPRVAALAVAKQETPAATPASTATPDRAPTPRPLGGSIAPSPSATLERTVATPRQATEVLGRAPELAPSSAPTRDHAPALDLATARQVWPDLMKKVGFNLGLQLSQVEPVAVIGPDVLVIAAKPGYNSVAEACGTPEALVKIEQGLQRLTHRGVNVRYERSPAGDEGAADARPLDARRADTLASDPLVQRVVELFEARTVQLDYDDPDSIPQT
jgi:DNA polymerase-3 subunit gamma/tau